MSLRSAIRPLMVCSALFAFGHVAAAQTKVGVINLQKAVLESAEIKAASAAMEARYKPRVAQIEQLNKEIAAIGENLQKNAGKLTAAGRSRSERRRARGNSATRSACSDDLQADVERERNEILQ